MTTWQEGRAAAHALGRDRREPVRRLPPGSARSLTAAADIRSPSELPAFDNSAMDGWAVAGEAPWRETGAILAGDSARLPPLTPGEARPITTGAPIPPATATIVRNEDASPRPSASGTLIEPNSLLREGRNIRRRGEELHRGETVLEEGSRITPPVLGLLTAAGVTEVSVRGPVPFAFIAVGEELCDDAADGSAVNDSLSAAVPALLESMGGRCVCAGRVGDRPDELAATISGAPAPVIVTSGGTARGRADPVREALRLLGAEVVLDGMDVRPGRSVLLSRTADLTILSLPGNPFAAIVDAVLLGWPLLSGRLGAPLPPARPYGHPMPGAGTGAGH